MSTLTVNVPDSFAPAARAIQKASVQKTLAVGVTGVTFIMTCVVLGITLSRHKVAGAVTAMTVLTSLGLLIPLYRLVYLQTGFDGRGSRTVYMGAGVLMIWLIIFAIVSAQAQPLASESFENIAAPAMPVHHGHHTHATNEEPVLFPNARKHMEHFDGSVPTAVQSGDLESYEPEEH